MCYTADGDFLPGVVSGVVGAAPFFFLIFIDTISSPFSAAAISYRLVRIRRASASRSSSVAWSISCSHIRCHLISRYGGSSLSYTIRKFTRSRSPVALPHICVRSRMCLHVLFLGPSAFWVQLCSHLLAVQCAASGHPFGDVVHVNTGVH